MSNDGRGVPKHGGRTPQSQDEENIADQQQNEQLNEQLNRDIQSQITASYLSLNQQNLMLSNAVLNRLPMNPTMGRLNHPGIPPGLTSHHAIDPNVSLTAGLPPQMYASTGPPPIQQSPQQQPTFVNAKQYTRILKRREARSKIEEYYRKIRNRLKQANKDSSSSSTSQKSGTSVPDSARGESSSTHRKPYIHESRHRHAMKRPRGPGGRFLTKVCIMT